MVMGLARRAIRCPVSSQGRESEACAEQQYGSWNNPADGIAREPVPDRGEERHADEQQAKCERKCVKTVAVHGLFLPHQGSGLVLEWYVDDNRAEIGSRVDREAHVGQVAAGSGGVRHTDAGTLVAEQLHRSDTS